MRTLKLLKARIRVFGLKIRSQRFCRDANNDIILFEELTKLLVAIVHARKLR